MACSANPGEQSSAVSGRPTATSPSLSYRADIDGLRGLAILAVLLHHVDSRLLPGGFVGVDIFFVISGFLITRILLCREASSAGLLVHFYARRVRRLIPAATVMVAFVSCACWLMFLPLDLKDFGASVAAYAAMASNFLFWRWDDYFAGQHKSWPLLHTWSLAVEEQFYLVFPCLIIGLRRLGPTFQFGGLALVFAASFAVSVWQSNSDPRSAYLLLPGRAWEMLAGGLCALAPPGVGGARLARQFGSIIAVACIAGPLWLYSETTSFPGVAAMFPVAGTAALIHFGAHGGSAVHSILATPLLVGCGLISYSLYLWHWPLLTLARYPWSAMAGSCPWFVSAAAGVAATFVAYLSYRFVERPTRYACAADSTVLGLAGVTCAAAMAFGITLHAFRGFPQRLPPEAVRYESAKTDFQPRRREMIDLPLSEIENGRLAVIGAASDSQPTFALWGDSLADALVPAFDIAAKNAGVSGCVLTRGATLPLVGLTATASSQHRFDVEFRNKAVARLCKERFPTVILAGRWSSALAGDVEYHGEVSSGPAEKLRLFADALQSTTNVLFSNGTRIVWLVVEVPPQPFNVPKQLALRRVYGWQTVQGISEDTFAATTGDANYVLRAASGDRVDVLDFSGFFFENGQSRLIADGWPLYNDDVHVSARAAALLAGAVAPVFSTMIRDAAVRDVSR